MTNGTKDKPLPELEKTSHEITGVVTCRNEVIYLDYKTEWEGRAAYVDMVCARYESRFGLEDAWSVEIDEATDFDGVPLGDPERAQLRQQLEPLAREWIASPDYRESEADAYFEFIKRAINPARSPDTNPPPEAQELLAEYEDKLSLAQRRRLTEALEASDAFSRFYRMDLRAGAWVETSEMGEW